jgi:hypothetical protein
VPLHDVTWRCQLPSDVFREGDCLSRRGSSRSIIRVSSTFRFWARVCSFGSRFPAPLPRCRARLSRGRSSSTTFGFCIRTLRLRGGTWA